MSSLLDKVKIVKGRLVRVFNQERKFGAAPLYVAVQVEDADGKNERCLLFTEAQIKDAEERAAANQEDLTTKSFLTDLID